MDAKAHLSADQGITHFGDGTVCCGRPHTPDLLVLLDRAEALPEKLERSSERLREMGKRTGKNLLSLYDSIEAERDAATVLRALLKVARTAEPRHRHCRDGRHTGSGAQRDKTECAALFDLRAILQEKGLAIRRRLMTDAPRTPSDSQRSTPSATPPMSVERAVEIIARHALAGILDPIMDRWEDYPDVGEDDWATITERAEALLVYPSDDEYNAAYALLKARATNEA